MNKINKAVHLDLNGMTPSFERCLELIPLFYDAGYNMLMLAWEDKFPWKETKFRADSIFSVDEILAIHNKASKYGMEFIPMIQTLGHLESYLCLDKYKHLREVPDRTDCLNPLAPGGLDFVVDLIDEMLALSPNIKYMHIGGDEVWNMGKNPETKAYIEKHSKAKLYIKHMRPIIDMLNAKGIRPLLWHDMMIKWDDDELLLLKDDVDIVFWGYAGTLQDTPHHYNIKHIKRFASLGMHLWGAGAFKGASGCASIIPDIPELVINASSWYDAVEEFNFKGVIATGWSRYSQFHPPCDPIFSSLDSLFIIGAIFNGEFEEDVALKKLAKSLKKYNLTQQFEMLKKTSIEFSGSYSRAWECIRNLQQEYVMEEKFLQGKNSHMAKIMFDALVEDMKIVQASADLLRKALISFSDKNEIAQFIDTKVIPLERIYREETKRMLLEC